MRTTSNSWRRAVKQRSGVCLTIAVLGCSDGTKSDDQTATTTASSSGTGGGSAATGSSNGGSGGSSVTSSSGGSGGSSVTSSNGGSGGSNVTSSNVGGAGGEASGGGLPIPFEDGWASEDQNELGIQGEFYTFSDSESDTDGNGSIGTSSIEPETFADSGAEICTHGSAGQVLDGPDGQPDYLTYWGAAIGFNLNQEEGEDAALAYDATAHKVVGFSFVVAGSSPIPPVGELRFNLKVAGDAHNYCTEIVAPGLSTFLFTDLWQDCWVVPSDTSPSLDPTQLEALHWQYVTTSTASYDFDICISDLRAIVEPD